MPYSAVSNTSDVSEVFGRMTQPAVIETEVSTPQTLKSAMVHDLKPSQNLLP
jgi:hypothetical protein